MVLNLTRNSQVPAFRFSKERVMTASHVPVMVQEVIDFLSPVPGAVFLDLTLGGGGHGFALLDAIQPSGVLIGCDRDGDAVRICREKFTQFGRYARVHHANYSDIRKILSEEGFDSVDGALFDLGLSSIQLDTPGRGFRMTSSDLLDMRMDPRGGTTAADLVNRLTEIELADIIYHYGEERRSRFISRAIGRVREKKPIERCDELAAIVASAVARSGGGGNRSRQKIHPATRTFQALRLAVNEELEALERTLKDVVDLLRPGARLVAISFHSLEDRIVKNVFRELSSGMDNSPSLHLITRKVIRPGVEELTMNPRARSAKLRAAEKRGSE